MPTARRAKREVRAEVKRLADLVEQAVDDGATTVEEIHRRIANLPLDVLARLDVFEKTVKDVRRVQDASIGAIYDVIRRVNAEVAKLADEILKGAVRRKPAAKKPAARAHASA
jgi:hypothetical protein